MRRLPLASPKPLSFLVVMLTTLSASAEVSTEERALASRLFDEATSLMNAGKAPEACVKYAESKRLDPQLGTLLYLGECFAKVGKSASAWVTFKEAADIAAQRGDPRTRRIRERLADIEKLVSNLTIVVGADEPADLELKRDGAVVGRAAWGVPMPIDPGEHAVVAIAPGFKTRELRVLVKQSGEKLVLTLPALERAASSGPTSAVPEVAKARNVPPPQTAQEDQPTWTARHRRTLALVAGGVGVAGVGAAGVFGLLASSKNDESKQDCSGNVCGPDGHAARESAFRNATVATALFGLGAAGLVTGTVLWLTAPPTASATPKRQSAFVTELGPNVAIIHFRGSW